MKIDAQKTIQIDVKQIRLHVKVCDGFRGKLIDAQGATVKDYEGYVPKFFPEEHYGDYLILNIDLETGQILNWKAPTAQQLEEFIAKD